MKKTLYQIFFLLLVSLVSGTVSAQSVGIGTNTPNASAQLDVSSTTKGTLITRMTSTQRKAIINPAAGLLVFDLDKNTVYMYDGHQWHPLMYTTSENKLPPFPVEAINGTSDDNFGFSVSISGDYAIVGANYDDTGVYINRGSAYIFYNSGGQWNMQAKLVASDGASYDYFGESVFISGDYAIIGAPFNDQVFSEQGSAYIFHRLGTVWTQIARLDATDGEASDHFGKSVSLSGDYAIIGAPDDNNGANTNQGSAYIFYRLTTPGGWITGQGYQAKLTHVEGAFGDQFGYSVSISGDYAIVGAPKKELGFVDQGAAYIFYRFTNFTGWTTNQAYQARLAASDGAAADIFGWCVSINGNYVIVGAPHSIPSAVPDPGQAYIFYRGSGWMTNQPYQTKLFPFPGANDDFFGSNVNLYGDYAIVGAAYSDAGLVTYQGSAFLYKRNGTFWGLQRVIDDDNGQASGLFGFSVATDGFNVLIGAYGKNGNKGEVNFLNIE